MALYISLRKMSIGILKKFFLDFWVGSSGGEEGREVREVKGSETRWVFWVVRNRCITPRPHGRQKSPKNCKLPPSSLFPLHPTQHPYTPYVKYISFTVPTPPNCPPHTNTIHTLSTMHKTNPTHYSTLHNVKTHNTNPLQWYIIHKTISKNAQKQAHKTIYFSLDKVHKNRPHFLTNLFLILSLYKHIADTKNGTQRTTRAYKPMQKTTEAVKSR